MPSNLIDSLNSSREQTIQSHYHAALAELEEKIKAEPLKKTFNIYSGCVSKDITNEISRRFNSKGIKVNWQCYGLISTRYYLVVEVELPKNLIPDSETEMP